GIRDPLVTGVQTCALPICLVGHHDLMRCFERMLRRAQLPFHSTEGFNPKPRLVFALSLGLGIVGCDEIVELELDEELPPEQIQSDRKSTRLNSSHEWN